MTKSRLKTVLLAAASLTAATTAVATAADRAPIEPVAIEHAVTVADHDAETRQIAGGRWAVLAAAAAAFGWLVGFRKIATYLKPAATAVARTAKAAASASGKAAKAVAHAVAKPFQFALFLGGLALVAFAGVGFYDVEWAAGLVIGVIFTASFLLGARRLRRAPPRASLTAD